MPKSTLRFIVNFLPVLFLFFTIGCEKKVDEPMKTEEAVSAVPSEAAVTDSAVPELKLSNVIVGIKGTPEEETAQESFDELVQNDFEKAFTSARELESKDPEAASRAYQSLTVDYPNRFEPYHRLARIFEEKQDQEAAIALYEEAMRMKPESAEFFNDFGTYCFTQSELLRAETLFLKANQLEPNNPKYMKNYAVTVALLGRWDDAFALFMKIPGSNAVATYNMIAMLQFEQGMKMEKEESKNHLFQKAEESLKKAESLAPENETSKSLRQEMQKYRESENL